MCAQDLMNAGVGLGGGADANGGRLAGGPSYIIFSPDASRQASVGAAPTLTSNAGKAYIILIYWLYS